MKPSLVSRTLETAIAAKTPCFLWGPPGVGKSQLVAQTANRLGLQLVDVRAVLLDPVDLRGIPAVNGDGVAHWCQPAFLPRSGRGILFLDELPAAPPLVQAACYQLVLDRKIGEYTLPDGWVVCAAGNREGDRAVTHRMPTPLKNRFLHISVDVDLDDWCTWAIRSGIETEIVAFCRFRPALLHDFDPKRTDNAFPTPRSWEMADRLVKVGVDAEIEYELLSGIVGPGAATEYLAFIRIYRSLPNIDGIIASPDTAPIPSEPAALYAVCGALAKRAGEQNIVSVLRYAVRLGKEFEVLLVLDAVRRTPAISNTRAMIEWYAANSSVLV